MKQGFFRHRLQRWLNARLPLCDHTELTQRNVFILPTRAGWLLAATLLVLLLASINYQLNLGYLITFLLTGSALASMLLGHANLRGLQLSLLPPQPVFAGSSAALLVQLHNPLRRPRLGLALAVMDSQHWSWSDVPAQAGSSVTLACSFRQRGRHGLPTLIVESRFPLGIFRVWTLWRPASLILVYPQPESQPPPLPAVQSNSVGAGQTSQPGGGDYDGIRVYRRGDPPKLIVWKKVAKSGQLVSREEPSQQPRQLWLDRQQTGALAHEQQLSRLCAWLLLAQQRDLHYGLRLGQTEIAPDQGQEHKKRCLEALALC